jgi:hypothetical protein
MLISHRKRFIYTKTAKTAGTSVESYFEPYCMADGSWEFRHARDEQISRDGIIGYRGPNVKGKQWWNHMPAREIRDAIGRSVWDAYFKFCVIRDPFDKLVSSFYFREQRKRSRYSLLGLYRKRNFFHDSAEGNEVERFRSWIRDGGSLIDRDKYVIDGQLCVDYCIRFEELHSGIKYVCDTLAIPFEPERIPNLKAGVRKHTIPLHAYYDAETIQFVKNLYSFELETFGYREPVPPSRDDDRCA